MAADYILEFRFEFLWPFWLVIRSLHDSFKYQGIIFSIFFALIAFLSDLLFYMFLPVQWLFFAASTYVWVQYVWHTEKGVCLPTISLWLLFVYIEASLRLKTSKTIDLCRPFAAHCIGYPMVTLGFGFKSYLSYKLRLKKQKEIQKLNEFHMQLIAKALPLELQIKDKEKFKSVNYEEQISSRQAVTSSTSSSILGTLYSFALSLNSNNSMTQSQIPAFSNNNNSNSANREKHGSNKSNNNQSGSGKENLCPKNSATTQSPGIIASALSFYLNSNNVNNNTNTTTATSNSEEAPYIQQKDNLSKQSFNNNYKNGSKYHNTVDSATDQINTKNNSDFNYSKNSFNNNNNNNNSKSNNYNSNFNEVTGNSFAKSNKTNTNPHNSGNSDNSVNCNVSSFSISSIATSTQASNNNSSSNSSTNLTSLNGNLVLLSNSKLGDGDYHDHHRSSSTSSNNSSFLPTNSNNHTNININMTINASAIAAATAAATANGTKGSSNNGNNKNRKSKESSSNNTQQRANSVASSTSSSSSSSSSTLNGLENGQKFKSMNENGIFSFKDDLISRLEEDLKKLREEKEQQKSVEQYLKNQISYMAKCDRTEKQKLEKIQQENKSLQTKMNKLATQTQKNKEDMDSMEKQLQEEKRLRTSFETQLTQEKKIRESIESKLQELNKKHNTHNETPNVKQKSPPTPSIISECNEKCSKKLKEFECENKRIAEDLRKKQDRVTMLETEMKTLTKSCDTENRVDTLMVALNLMEEKNASLQESLSAETRFKLDLFSALGEARRQLESVNYQLKSKERELNAFKAFFKQTLSASSNVSLNNNILNNYLNGGSIEPVNQSQNDTNNTKNLSPNMKSNSNDTSNNKNGSCGTNSSVLPNQNSTGTSNLNDWSTPFLPKI